MSSELPSTGKYNRNRPVSIDPHRTQFNAPLAVMGAILAAVAWCGWEARGYLATTEARLEALLQASIKIEAKVDALGSQDEISNIVANRFLTAKARCPNFVTGGRGWGICDMIPESIRR